MDPSAPPWGGSTGTHAQRQPAHISLILFPKKLEEDVLATVSLSSFQYPNSGSNDLTFKMSLSPSASSAFMISMIFSLSAGAATWTPDSSFCFGFHLEIS